MQPCESKYLCACQNCTEAMLELFLEHIKFEKHTWPDLKFWEARTFPEWSTLFRHLMSENNFLVTADFLKYVNGAANEASMNKREYYKAWNQL